MIIKNAQIFQNNGSFKLGNLKVEGSFINGLVESVYNDENIIDGNGLYAIPGLVDIHFHGCMGVDFCDGNEKAISTIADYELSKGITSICPATMTIPINEINNICKVAAEHKNEKGAFLRGINLEGPFISKEKKGAQNEKDICLPDASLARKWFDLSNGLCKLIDIAPEVSGAMEFIKDINKLINVSIAHTTADYEIAKEAFKNGANHVTHLYNAMPGFSHRAPGVIGAAAENENVYVEMICDGIHIHQAVIKATFSMFSENRIVLISDSIEATGLEDGNYKLGGQKVKVVGKKAVLDDGTIAGSATNLMDCLRFVVNEVKIPLGKAVKCATVNPAKSIGIYDKVGSLDSGKTADILLVDHNLKIYKIIHNGKLINF